MPPALAGGQNEYQMALAKLRFWLKPFKNLFILQLNWRQLKKILTHKMKNLKNITIALLVSIFALTLSNAQTSDTNFRKPVSETLKKSKPFFISPSTDDRGLLKGKELDYADWRIEQGNLAVSLTNILAPFELMYFKQPDGTYIIQKI